MFSDSEEEIKKWMEIIKNVQSGVDVWQHDGELMVFPLAGFFFFSLIPSCKFFANQLAITHLTVKTVTEEAAFAKFSFL